MMDGRIPYQHVFYAGGNIEETENVFGSAGTGVHNESLYAGNGCSGNNGNGTGAVNGSVAGGKRPVLRDLTPNSPVPARVSGMLSDGKGGRAVEQSPLRNVLKRGSGGMVDERGYRGGILDEERGFSYLKRRRLGEDGGEREGQREGEREQRGEVRHTPLFAKDKATTPLFRKSNPTPLFNRDRSTPLFNRDRSTPLYKIHHTHPPTNHGRQSPAQFRPLSPPSSAKDAAQQRPSTQQSTTEEKSSTAKDSDSDSGSDSQNSVQTRTSFSSLINYDPSSQQTLASQALDALQPRGGGGGGGGVVTDTARARAEALKMRLKVAFYKVQTNQINVPFGRLRVPVSSTQSTPRASRQPQPSHDESSTLHDHISSREDEEQGRRSHNNNYNHNYGLGLGIGTSPAVFRQHTTPTLFSTPFFAPPTASTPFIHTPPFTHTTPTQRDYQERHQRVPSSSPPLIHLPPRSSVPPSSSSLPRYQRGGRGDVPSSATRGRGGGGGDVIEESLDSEATELAEELYG